MRFRAGAAALLCAAATLAAGPPQPGTTTQTAHLSVAASAGPVVSGKPAVLYLDISPKPKMHVYAPGEKDVIPVALTLAANAAIKPGKVVFPPAEKYFFPPLKLTQLVYSKPFRLTLPVAIAKAPADGTLTITGTLEYQACDDAVCYVPKTVPVQWALKTR